MTSKASNPQEEPVVAPEAETDPTALNAEQLDEVRGDGAYPLPRGTYCTGQSG